MNTKTLTPRALDVIDQYLHFKVGSAVCAVPYFNNKTVRARASLRAENGKGSPQDIFDEVQGMLVNQHIMPDAIADDRLKKLLADNNIGIDCSGFAYYVFNAESAELGKGALDKRISFVNCHGWLGTMRAKFRLAENCDVSTLAADANSRIIALNEAAPGDVITMTSGPEGGERDHILVIHQADYQNFSATKLYYSHAVAYPEDGVYGSGVRQGTIEIVSPGKALTEQLWNESDSVQGAARIFARVQKSKTELRRMKWF